MGNPSDDEQNGSKIININPIKYNNYIYEIDQILKVHLDRIFNYNHLKMIL